jgi:uncharacterized protein
LIVYFDTSALLTRYVAEPDSDVVAALWKARPPSRPRTSCTPKPPLRSLAESASSQPPPTRSTKRSRRSGKTGPIHRVAVDDAIDHRVDDLLTRYPLRGADAVHLASALLVRDALLQAVTFACADIKLVTRCAR